MWWQGEKEPRVQFDKRKRYICLLGVGGQEGEPHAGKEGEAVCDFGEQKLKTSIMES